MSRQYGCICIEFGSIGPRRRWLALAATFVLLLFSISAGAEEPPEQEAMRLAQTRQKLTDEGRYEEAIAPTERLLELRERLRGPDHPDTVLTVRYLARLYQWTGQYKAAERLFQRAVETLERTKKTGHADYVSTLRQLASLYRYKGDFEVAEPIYRKVLELTEAAYGREDQRVVGHLQDLALLRRDMDDYAGAERLLLRALAVVEKEARPAVVGFKDLIATGDDPGEGVDVSVYGALQNESAIVLELARLYRRMGDPARAEQLGRRALALDEKALGPNAPDVAVILDELAVLHLDIGKPELAEPLIQRSLAIREAYFGKDHARVAACLHIGARVRLARNDPRGAEALARRALAITEAAHGPEHRNTAVALFDVADALAAQGTIGEAVPLATRAAEIEDQETAVALAVGSEAQRRAHMASRKRSTDALISLHARGFPGEPAALRLALATVLKRKGRVLDAMMESFTSLRARLGKEEQALLDQLANVAGQIAARAAHGRDGPKERAALGALEGRRRELEAEIGRRSALFRAEQALVSLADIERALPDKSALVEIVRYQPVDLRRDPAARPAAPRYAAYVLAAGRQAFRDLGEASAIDAAVVVLRRALADPDLTHDPTPAARSLDALVGAPIRSALGDIRRVFLSPDGALHLVPFGALADEQGRYMLEGYSFTYLTSGRELLRFRASAPPAERALILADPAFGGARPGSEGGQRASMLSSVAFPPLPSTAREAQAVERAVPGARVLLGAAASEVALKAVRGPSVLHIATHGFFLPAPSSDPARAPASDAGKAEAHSAARVMQNPLLRSGIALAGANARASGGEDGILTALEASTLDLRGTRLVVLSACETGVGEASSGEGVYGLRRALAMAGAEAQVMSLWPVDTGRTRELMTLFYDRLRSGSGPSEALREAALAMRAEPKTSHPNLWASFIAAGSYAPLGEGVIAKAPPRAAPGARGCGCSLADEDRGAIGPSLAGLALALALWVRRRPRVRGAGSR